MPQYITDNTDDELSHAAFLHAFLRSRGEVPVDLEPFRNLPSSQATGARQIKRLTNLMNLNVDLSWYTWYRSGKNPDLGAAFKGPFVIKNQPAIPLNDTDTPPSTNPAVPIAGRDAERIQAIVNTAGFHFAFIEQGGASLYPTLAFKANDPTVVRIPCPTTGRCNYHWSQRLFLILAASSSLELFTQLKEDLCLKVCFNLCICWSSSESPCSCSAPRSFPNSAKA